MHILRNSLSDQQIDTIDLAPRGGAATWTNWGPATLWEYKRRVKKKRWMDGWMDKMNEEMNG